MSDQLDPNHPRQKLVFFVAGPVDDATRKAVAEFVGGVGETRNWLLGAPQHVSEHEVPEDQSHGEHCVDDVGAFLDLYSVHPPWTLPREIDLRHFDEATALLTALAECSRRLQLNFDVYYAGEVIGSVSGGEMDEGVREGLLGEWKRVLDQSA